MEQHCCVTVCVCMHLSHTYLSKNRVVWPSVLAQHWPNCGYIIMFAIKNSQYILGKDILLLAFVSLSRELVRLRQALEWRQ